MNEQTLLLFFFFLNGTEASVELEKCANLTKRLQQIKWGLMGKYLPKQQK